MIGDEEADMVKVGSQVLIGENLPALIQPWREEISLFPNKRSRFFLFVFFKFINICGFLCRIQGPCCS